MMMLTMVRMMIDDVDDDNGVPGMLMMMTLTKMTSMMMMVSSWGGGAAPLCFLFSQARASAISSTLTTLSVVFPALRVTSFPECLHKKGYADRTPARDPGRGPGPVLRLAPRLCRGFLALRGPARRRGWKRIEKLVRLGPWSLLST